MARPAHRPTKFTPPAVDAYLAARRLGLPKKDCAAAADWSDTLACHFTARGQEARERQEAGHRLTAPETRFLEFLAADEKAEAFFKQACMASVLNAARQPAHWTAAAWALERRDPANFGRRTLEVSGPNGGPIQVDVRASELLDRLRQLTAGPAELNGHADVIDVEVDEA